MNAPEDGGVQVGGRYRLEDGRTASVLALRAGRDGRTRVVWALDPDGLSIPDLAEVGVTPLDVFARTAAPVPDWCAAP